eukprot:jgi/Psemu1/30720/gm1.30720_g
MKKDTKVTSRTAGGRDLAMACWPLLSSQKRQDPSTSLLADGPDRNRNRNRNRNPIRPATATSTSTSTATATATREQAKDTEGTVEPNQDRCDFDFDFDFDCEESRTHEWTVKPPLPIHFVPTFSGCGGCSSGSIDADDIYNDNDNDNDCDCDCDCDCRSELAAASGRPASVRMKVLEKSLDVPYFWK